MKQRLIRTVVEEKKVEEVEEEEEEGSKGKICKQKAEWEVVEAEAEKVEKDSILDIADFLQIKSIGTDLLN